MQKFFDKLKLEREDVREDLEGIDPKGSEWRRGDFGCGWGLPTLCLILELHPSECIGIDPFVKEEILDVPSIDEVQCQFAELRNYCSSDLLQDNCLEKDVRDLIDVGNLPRFLVSDVTNGSNLPSNLDLAYCKKLLYNIFKGDYPNDLKGEDGVITAIKNISSTIRLGGWICVIEPVNPEIDFMPYLEQESLRSVCRSPFERGEIIMVPDPERRTLYKTPYIKYVCTKI
jgi:hypothetical protein